jgi:hypothetical protein
MECRPRSQLGGLRKEGASSRLWGGRCATFLRNWVSLRIDPDREASTWTRHVLGALWNLRNEAVHGMDPQSR